MLRLFLIVLIGFLSKIAAEAYDDDKIFFESSLRSREINRRQARIERDEKMAKSDSDGNETSSFNFGYRNTTEWSVYYPDCGGRRQSPVDIETHRWLMRSQYITSVFKIEGYQKTPNNMTIVNNGHTVQLTGSWENDDDIPHISGGILDGDYAFLRVDFHWGVDKYFGSEHTIDSVAYSLEMQIFHYKKDYGSPSEAMKHEDGLATVGIFFGLSPYRPSGNNGISILQKYAKAIKYPNSQVQISPFPLSELYPANILKSYLTYTGSLTSPPCSEIVRWIFPLRPMFTNTEQVKFFQSIELSNGDDHNNRPTEKLKNHLVSYIFSL